MPKYGIKISLINEDGDEEETEVLAGVSYEHAAEALGRIVYHHERREAEKRNIIPDEDEQV